ncbi:unnamed protein product [Anisakis simplex]|uniref:Mediator of RNA polymerase II transcription subunit 13 n=1 Tax=Anisakis simplex TaxID=6269 RepID=A0A0M3JXL6_ANISI|nr:unnamed protein product [Anisakis simplex]
MSSSSKVTPTNGGTLEDCHTNVFALTELNGLKWKCLTTPLTNRQWTNVENDPILQAYSKCLQSGILCAWRRQPTHTSNQLSTLQLPDYRIDVIKELWIFWYSQDEPEALAQYTSNLACAEDGVGNWSVPGIQYETRTLFFKALHNLIERNLLKNGYIRIGKYFTQPYDLPLADRMHCSPSYITGISFNFFVHGENTVCTSVSVQRQPTIYKLTKQHLNNHKKQPIILGPWSIRAFLIAEQPFIVNNSYGNGGMNSGNNYGGGAMNLGVNMDANQFASSGCAGNAAGIGNMGYASTMDTNNSINMGPTGTGNINSNEKVIDKLYNEWLQFFALPNSGIETGAFQSTVRVGENKENSRENESNELPKMVLVDVDGIHMWYPSSLIVVQACDDLLLRNEGCESSDEDLNMNMNNNNNSANNNGINKPSTSTSNCYYYCNSNNKSNKLHKKYKKHLHNNTNNNNIDNELVNENGERRNLMYNGMVNGARAAQRFFEEACFMPSSSRRHPPQASSIGLLMSSGSMDDDTRWNFSDALRRKEKESDNCSCRQCDYAAVSGQYRSDNLNGNSTSFSTSVLQSGLMSPQSVSRQSAQVVMPTPSTSGLSFAGASYDVKPDSPRGSNLELFHRRSPLFARTPSPPRSPEWEKRLAGLGGDGPGLVGQDNLDGRLSATLQSPNWVHESHVSNPNSNSGGSQSCTPAGASSDRYEYPESPSIPQIETQSSSRLSYRKVNRKRLGPKVNSGSGQDLVNSNDKLVKSEPIYQNISPSTSRPRSPVVATANANNQMSANVVDSLGRLLAGNETGNGSKYGERGMSRRGVKGAEVDYYNESSEREETVGQDKGEEVDGCEYKKRRNRRKQRLKMGNNNGARKLIWNGIDSLDVSFVAKEIGEDERYTEYGSDMEFLKENVESELDTVKTEDRNANKNMQYIANNVNNNNISSTETCQSQRSNMQTYSHGNNNNSNGTNNFNDHCSSPSTVAMIDTSSPMEVVNDSVHLSPPASNERVEPQTIAFGGGAMTNNLLARVGGPPSVGDYMIYPTPPSVDATQSQPFSPQSILMQSTAPNSIYATSLASPYIVQSYAGTPYITNNINNNNNNNSNNSNSTIQEMDYSENLITNIKKEPPEDKTEQTLKNIMETDEKPDEKLERLLGEKPVYGNAKKFEIALSGKFGGDIFKGDPLPIEVKNYRIPQSAYADQLKVVQQALQLRQKRRKIHKPPEYLMLKAERHFGGAHSHHAHHHHHHMPHAICPPSSMINPRFLSPGTSTYRNSYNFAANNSANANNNVSNMNAAVAGMQGSPMCGSNMAPPPHHFQQQQQQQACMSAGGQMLPVGANGPFMTSNNVPYGMNTATMNQQGMMMLGNNINSNNSNNNSMYNNMLPCTSTMPQQHIPSSPQSSQLRPMAMPAAQRPSQLPHLSPYSQQQQQGANNPAAAGFMVSSTHHQNNQYAGGSAVGMPTSSSSTQQMLMQSMQVAGGGNAPGAGPGTCPPMGAGLSMIAAGQPGPMMPHHAAGGTGPQQPGPGGPSPPFQQLNQFVNNTNFNFGNNSNSNQQTAMGSGAAQSMFQQQQQQMMYRNAAMGAGNPNLGTPQQQHSINSPGGYMMDSRCPTPIEPPPPFSQAVTSHYSAAAAIQSSNAAIYSTSSQQQQQMMRSASQSALSSNANNPRAMSAFPQTQSQPGTPYMQQGGPITSMSSMVPSGANSAHLYQQTRPNTVSGPPLGMQAMLDLNTQGTVVPHAAGMQQPQQQHPHGTPTGQMVPAKAVPLHPEGKSLVLAILLQDTVLDLHYDCVFDACPICSCNANIRAKELGMYITPPEVLRQSPAQQQLVVNKPTSGFYNNTSNHCNCGFSAVRHRYLSMKSGLFSEDAKEATDISENQTQPVIPHTIWFDSMSGRDMNFIALLREQTLVRDLGGIVQKVTMLNLQCERATQLERLGSDSSDPTEYIISEIDQRELPLVYQAACEVACMEMNCRRQKSVNRNIVMHEWGVQIANEMREPRESECLAVLNEVAPILEETLRIARSAPLVGTNNIVEGPLTWRFFDRKSLKTGSGMDDDSAPEPVPNILLASERDAIIASPTILRMWDKMQLEPYDQPKDILYIAVIPDNQICVDKSKKFFDDLSRIYEQCRFGRHIPFSRDPFKDGLLRVPSRYLSTTNHSEFDNFLNQVERHMADYKGLIAKLKAYMQYFENEVSRVLLNSDCVFNRDTYRSLIVEQQMHANLAASHNSSNSASYQTGGGAMSGSISSACEQMPPPAAPGSVSAGLGSAGNSQMMDTSQGGPRSVDQGGPLGSSSGAGGLLNCSAGSSGSLVDSIGSSDMSGGLGGGNDANAAMNSGNPGGTGGLTGSQLVTSLIQEQLNDGSIPDDDPGALPHVIVLYLVNPFLMGAEENALVARVVTVALMRSFNALLYRLNVKRRTQLQLEIVSLESIFDYNTNCADFAKDDRGRLNAFDQGRIEKSLNERMTSSDSLKTLALSVYSQSRIVLSDIVRGILPKSMTRFGPASAMNDLLNEIDKKEPIFYKVPCKPYILAPPSPVMQKCSGDIMQLNSDETVLFVSYCLIGNDWLGATVTDHQGHLLDNCLINLRLKPDHKRVNMRYKSSTQIRDSLYRLWSYILGILATSTKNWRLVIGRVGRIGHGEFKFWTQLLSKSYLKQVGSKMKQACRSCHMMPGTTEIPGVLSACLVSLEPEAHLRLFPSSFQHDERFVKNAKYRTLTTPDDCSCTHILVFPTSPELNLDHQGGSGGGECEEDDFSNLLSEEIGEEFSDLIGNGEDLMTNTTQQTQQNGSFRVGGNTGIPSEYADITIENQPLATGYYVSTAPAAELPDWFWCACPSAKRRNPVHLKCSLHLNTPCVQQGDDISSFGSKQSEQSHHQLDSQATVDVLRYVLETYNALSWLNMDFVTGERRSCLPIHIQALMRLCNTANRLIN